MGDASSVHRGTGVALRRRWPRRPDRRFGRSSEVAGLPERRDAPRAGPAAPEVPLGAAAGDPESSFWAAFGAPGLARHRPALRGRRPLSC